MLKLAMSQRFFKVCFFYYIPIIFWVGIIFYLSGRPDLKVVGDKLVVWEIILRKFGHVSEYLILGWLFFRLMYQAHGQKLNRSLVWSMVFVLLFSISDEYHQTFVPGRQGKLIDVVVDSIGALLGLQMLNIYYKSYMRKLKIFFLIVVLAILAGIVGHMVWQGVNDKNGQLKSQSSIDAEDKSLLSAVEEFENKAVRKVEQKIDDVSQQTDNLKQTVGAEDRTTQLAADGLPKRVKLDVPFTSQAPFGNWDAVHEETCEEASLIMLKAYLNKETLTAQGVEDELQKLVAYENKIYGDYKDSDMQEVLDMAKNYYHINNLKIIYDFDKEEIKRQLAKGNPIILPTAGRRLGNPNFTGAGPLYHNLVAIGYDGKKIITNDPGTRKGQGYIYDEDVLYNAIHDFPGKPEDIEKGRKAMIVVE